MEEGGIAMPCRFGVTALLLALMFSGVALGAEAGNDGFLAMRADAIRLYGEASPARLETLYQDATAAYAENGVLYQLHRRAVYAELAGLKTTQAKALLEAAARRDADPGLVLFMLEVLRSRGLIAQNSAAVADAVDRLSGDARLRAVRTLGVSFRWTRPPAEIETLVRGEAGQAARLEDLMFLAGVLSSWGRGEEAQRLLARRAGSPGENVEARLHAARGMAAMGFDREALDIAESTFSALRLSPPAEGIPLSAVETRSEDRLEAPAALAQVAGAWDVLLEKTSVAEPRPDAWRIFDRAAVLAAAGLSGEKAETMALLAELTGSPEAKGLLGAALLEAGDAYGAGAVLFSAVLSESGAGDNAHLDLIDSLTSAGDADMLSTLALVYSLSQGSPQSARMMSEIMRHIGNMAAADQLFAAFIELSNLGASSRFNWEGSRLLASYYLDTGRLVMGRETARTALRQYVDLQGARTSARSPHPERFAALFERFGGVEELLEYCRERKGDFPGGTTLKRMEMEALIRLGRADEALAAAADISKDDPPQVRNVDMAGLSESLGRYEQAQRLYEEALSAGGPVPATVRASLAGLYARSQRWDDAREALLNSKELSLPDSYASAADFFDSIGEDAFAAPLYERLDDLTLNVSPMLMGKAVRFLVREGRYGSAASMFAKRISAQSSFAAKADYLIEILPRESLSVAKTLAFGAALEETSVGIDHQFMGLLYGELARRAVMFADGAGALAAAEAAVAQEADNAISLRMLVFAAAGNAARGVVAAANAAYEKAPSRDALFDLIEQELAEGHGEAAYNRIAYALELPLGIDDTGIILDLMERYGAPDTLVVRVSAKARASWPWTYHARLAEIALLCGADEVAAREAGIVAAETGYIGRTLWVARFYARLDGMDEAKAALAEAIAKQDHPALRLLEMEIAYAEGDGGRAAGLAVSAAQAFGRRPYTGLFAAERAFHMGNRGFERARQ